MTTVTVTPVEDHRALLMDWTKHPDKSDVRNAFQTMTEFLKAADAPLWIIVDVSAHPQFPLSETIAGAFWGPFRNPMLAEWLVVGASMTEHTIGRTLTGLSRRDNIRWFDTMSEAMAYLAAAEAGAPL